MKFAYGFRRWGVLSLDQAGILVHSCIGLFQYAINNINHPTPFHVNVLGIFELWCAFDATGFRCCLKESVREGEDARRFLVKLLANFGVDGTLEA